ncbi:MAG: hypothetical protein EOO96_05340 [Pedobacter sp.]|nr:MAG: hypothetical protein EOO96_05340 [Pedobacter sp.]
MKKIKTLIILFFSCLAILFAYELFTVFDPIYDSAEIKQRIGGTLVCKAEFVPDIHSSPNVVSYLYKHNEGTIDLGYGFYTEREWPKNEQILKIGNWLVLKTGGEFESDKLIIGNIHLPKWNEYELTPENIEKEELWRTANISSLISYCCAQVYITNIKNGIIEVSYKYRTDEKQTEKYAFNKIYYKIDDKTGMPIMIKIR